MRLEDLHNQRLGRYMIIALLGRGGMAAIYRARDTALDRDVAIKVLYPQYHADTALTERFKREAIMAAGLDHPNIVPIYDVGETDGLVYIAMKLLSGRSLADLLRERTRLPLPQVNAIVAQIADALDYAHSQGIIHRDIKPANILLDESRTPDRPRVLLTDFGIAKSLSDVPGLTSTSMMIGTPDYMPPELITKQPVRPQTDVYSLGVLVFRCLTGRQPFQGTTEAILLGHLYAEVPQPSLIDPALPPAIDAVMLKALARNPDQRYATAGALAQVLQDVEAGRPIGTNIDAPTVKGTVRPPAARPAPLAPIRTTAAAPNPTPLAPVRTAVYAPDPAPARPAQRRSFLLPFAALALVLVLLLALIANWPPEGLQAFTGASNIPTQPVEPPASPTDAAPTEPPAPTAEPTTMPTNTPADTPTVTPTTTPTTEPTATTAPPTVAPTQKPLPQPTRTRVPPSPTFTSVPPTATETPTNTPTATPTATPTETPTTTPTSTPAPCPTVPGVDEDFAYLVNSNADVRQRIGCPQSRTIESDRVAEQPFESGSMYWFEWSDTFYVFAGRETGIWRRFTKEQVSAMEGQPTAVPPAPDMRAPTGSGFALIWTHVPQVARDLGSVISEETYTISYSTGAWQQFEHGTMLSSEDSLGRGMTIYVLYDNGRFEIY